MGITKDNFDAVLPENYKLVYLGELSELQGQTQSETLEAIYTKFNIDHPADYKAHSLSVSDIVVLHENGENTAHFVDSFGFTELPKFMLTLEGKENEIETELAVHIADRYILMHECDEGYDYSILNEQYHLLDGGVYDNPDITIQRAMDMVIADLKEPRFSAVTEQYYRDDYLQGEVYAGSEIEIVDYEELSEKAEQVEQADLEARQAEFRENNPDVVADFRAKTEELFHSLDGQSAEDIEKTVYAYVQSQIDEYGLDAEIVDVVVAGSRCRGIERKIRTWMWLWNIPVPPEKMTFSICYMRTAFISLVFRWILTRLQRAEPEHWRLIFRRWKLTCRRRHSRSRSTISLSRRGEKWCRNKTHLYQKNKCFLNWKKSL